MAHLRPPFQKDIYKDFKRIEVGALRTLVYYYEQYEEAIACLEEEQYVEMTIDYLQALYQLKWYNRFIDTVDKGIELVICYNIYTYQGENLFEKLLFQKGVACTDTMDYEGAIKVLQSLLNINPDYPKAYQQLQKACFLQSPSLLRPIKASIIALSLFIAFLLGIKVLVISNFYPSYQTLFDYSCLYICGSMISILVMFSAWHLLRVYFRALAIFKNAQAYNTKKKAPSKSPHTGETYQRGSEYY